MLEDIQYQTKLAEVLLDDGEPVIIAGKTYMFKALKMRTRWQISKCINQMQIAEKDTINIVESMFTDIPLLARLITYAILRDKDKIEDKALFDKTYEDVLDCEDNQEYLNAITTIIKLLDIDWFFFTQEIAKGINILPSKAGLREKNQQKMKEQEYTMHPVTSEKSQE